MRAVIDWMFKVPDTDDPHVRRRVVWILLILNFLMFIGLSTGIHYVAQQGARLNHEIGYQQNLCHQQRNGRAALNRMLARQGMSTIPQINCTTGLPERGSP